MGSARETRHYLLTTATALALSFEASASKFDLPVQISCGEQGGFFHGAAVCSIPWGSPVRLKVKTPPTRGQLRVVDCDQVLTKDGNPDDFNMVIDKVGFWLWQRRVIRIDSPPEFVFPLRNFNDCPAVVSVAGQNAGVQSAIILIDHRFHTSKPTLHDYLTFSCSGPFEKTSGGLGVCKGLEGGRFSVKPTVPQPSGTMFLVGSSCGITRTMDLSKDKEAEVYLPNGSCILDVGMVVDQKKYKSRFLLIGEDRTARKIDSPIMIKERDGRRVYRPQGANMTSTEIYHEGGVLWRSGVRDQDSYTIDPDKDNAEPYKSKGIWPRGAIACHTAYAEDIDSIGGSCYDLNTLVEKPYFFR